MYTGFSSSVIDAPIDRVWATVRDFNGLPTWHPAIARSEIEGGQPSDTIGCIRSFYLQDGGHIRETLLAFSDEEHSFTYDMLEGPMSWWDYEASFKLLPVTDGNRTYAEWTARFEATPEDADGLLDLVQNGVFQGGFDALKEKLG